MLFFYNFTTPEFNVNVCQLPFWALVVFYSWKIYDVKEIKFLDCFWLVYLVLLVFYQNIYSHIFYYQSVFFSYI